MADLRTSRKYWTGGGNKYLEEIENSSDVPCDGKAPSHAPQFMRELRSITFPEFKKLVDSYDREFTDSMFAGDAYIIRGVVNPDSLRKLKADLHAWGQNCPPSFHKVQDGVPNFHRIITDDLVKKYALKYPRHDYYFFRHNADPFGVWPMINEFWSYTKKWGGFAPDECIQNVPSDGLVDRIVVAHYPAGIGYIERHQDPWGHQRTIMSIQMTQRGEDFQSGGLYFIDREGREITSEGITKIGDAVINYPTVAHGVHRIDENAPRPDWNSINGRWFFGLYTMETDCLVHARHTGKPA
ncbi:MAG: hypothetical protein AAB229_03355 [Candidatus Hydrogenedentota bacterium]